MIADKLDHLAAMLAIVTPATLACPIFQASLRHRLIMLAAEARELALLAQPPADAAVEGLRQ